MDKGLRLPNRKRFLVGLFLSLLIPAMFSLSAEAASCSPSNDPYAGANIGFLIVAQSCLSQGRSTYNYYDLNCSNGVATALDNFLSPGTTLRTGDEEQTYILGPFASLLNQVLPGQPYKIFRNSSGSIFVITMNGYAQEGGTIDDINIASYPNNPTVNTVSFTQFAYDKALTPGPCCLQISNFTAAPPTIKPKLGETTTLSAGITSNYPITWNLSINDRTTNGSGGGASYTWNGKNADSSLAAAGVYGAALNAVSGGCSTGALASVTVTEPPNKSTDFSCFGSSANLAGGGLTHREEIISVKGGLLPLSLGIDYNSQDTSSGALGPNWRHTMDITLTDAGNSSLLFREGGTRRLYTYSGGVYQSPSGDHCTLTAGAGGTHDLSYRNGLVYHLLSNGKIDTITDRYGNRLSFGYPNGDLETVTDSSGQALTFTYDTPSPPHWLQSVTDPKSGVFTFTPENGRLKKVTNPQTDTGVTAGYRQFNYDPVTGMLTSRLDPYNNLTQYTFDSGKRIQTSIDPDGASNPQYHTRTITYPASYSIPTMTTTFTEKDGGVWSYKYDVQKGVITEITAPAIAPDPAKTTKYYYDGTSGNLRAITVPYNNNVSLTTFYSYDGYGNLLTETDPVDISIYSNFDPSTATPASLAALIPPILTAVSYAWDAADRITQINNVRDTTALTTNITYTTEAVTGYELTTITDPELITTKMRRDPTNGKVMEIEDGNGKKTIFTYYPVTLDNTANGKAGMPESITGPNMVKTTVSAYDKDGNPLSIQATDANNNPVPVVTSLVHDALNRLRIITQNLTAQGKTLTGTNDYDQYGTLTVKDPEQNANNTSGTRYEFNYNRKVKRITDALSGVTDFTYGGQSCPSCGGVDQLTAVKDPRQYALGANGKSTMFLYNKVGRLERETHPQTKVIRYTYYDNGLLKGKYDATAGDPGILLMSYTYNNRGQILTKTRSDGSYDQYTYKTNSFMDTATTKNPDNTILISYNFDWYKNGWLKSVTDISNNRTIIYDLYDGIGQRKTVTYFSASADQRVLTYDYDPANRPWHITDDFGTSGNTADDLTFTYGYDERGRRKTLDFPNNIKATYGSDDLDQLTSLTHQINGGGNIVSFAYPLYDNAGNRKSKTVTTDSAVTETYIYDPLYRIYQTVSPSGTEEFHYDAVGNRTSGPGPMDTRFVADAANRMTSGRLYDYTYDNWGNQTVRTVPNGPDKTWTQTWDSENRLTQVMKTKGTEIRTVTFAYDPFGRRIGKTFTIKRGDTTKTSNSWSYVYDNEDIVLEIYMPTSGPPEKTFVIQGSGIDEPLALVRGGQHYTYHADGLGSIAAIADQNRNVVERYSYDSYGMPKQSLGFRNSYAYTGREWDKETGLYYYRARYYDPMEGRFIQKDPIGFRGGINIYAYVQNNPVNFVDPFGLWGLGAIGSGSAEAGAVGIGAGATGAIGGGIFGGGPQGVNLGGFGSFGAFAGGPGYGPAYPGNNSNNVVGGAFAGGGGGVFATNAKCAGALKGPFDTYSFNIGVGPIKFSAQFGISDGTWIGSVTVGPGIGISGSGYPTNTWATK